MCRSQEEGSGSFVSIMSSLPGQRSLRYKLSPRLLRRRRVSEYDFSNMTSLALPQPTHTLTATEYNSSVA